VTSYTYHPLGGWATMTLSGVALLQGDVLTVGRDEGVLTRGSVAGLFQGLGG
jgi:hypothetical protein